MTKYLHNYIIGAAALLLPLCSSCLHGEQDDYEEWRQLNDAYISRIDLNVYEKIVPDWAPQNSVYIQWHNDRSLTANNLVPMSNSTVMLKYELEDINGTKIENSYSKQDSVYISQPNQNVMGMMIAMTHMHVGDSVTMIIPYPSGYGSEYRNSMKPYTNLIFHAKLKGIKAYEKPNS